MNSNEEKAFTPNAGEDGRRGSEREHQDEPRNILEGADDDMNCDVESIYGYSEDEIINYFDDDECTIEEEEKLSPEMRAEDEIRLLTEDVNMTLEEMIDCTGRRRTRRPINKSEKLTPVSTAVLESSLTQSSSLLPVLPWVPSLPSTSQELSNPVQTSYKFQSELAQFYSSRMLDNDPMRVESDEEDGDFVYPIPALNSEIRVGEEYQASFEDLENGSQLSEDEMMWSPTNLVTDDELDKYCVSANDIIGSKLPGKKLAHTNPLALQCLLKCNYDTSEALNILREEVSVKEKEDDILQDVIAHFQKDDNLLEDVGNVAACINKTMAPSSSSCDQEDQYGTGPDHMKRGN